MAINYGYIGSQPGTYQVFADHELVETFECETEQSAAHVGLFAIGGNYPGKDIHVVRTTIGDKEIFPRTIIYSEPSRVVR